MSRKLISVIIPTYNRAHLIAKAIRSVKSQTYPAIQIIVADDGSGDDTAEIVSQFAGVEYYRQENKGQGAARNLGLKYAKGEYIASLDSDDIWDENFLQSAADALERNDADFVFLNWTEFSATEESISCWENGKTWQKYANYRDGDWSVLESREVRHLFATFCPAPSSALLIKRSSISDGWCEEMKIADDWYLILNMVLKKNCRAAFTLKPHWKKHVHIDNIYHGRDQLEVLQEFGLHDQPIFAEHFHKYLTSSEKAIMRRNSAYTHLNYVRLKMKREGYSAQILKPSSKMLRFILTAFMRAPLGSSLFVLQVFIDHLKNRYRIHQAERIEKNAGSDFNAAKSLNPILKSKADRKI